MPRTAWREILIFVHSINTLLVRILDTVRMGICKMSLRVLSHFFNLYLPFSSFCTLLPLPFDLTFLLNLHIFYI
jgi:hypothetical protein